ncbi:MAG: hypothetical protein OZ933_16085 [Chloroflexota bacterium]|nr:hypothetical protein [Chloroflexota bacterium]
MNSHTISEKTSTLHRIAELYTHDCLPDIVELVDQVHTAVSCDVLPLITTLSAEDVADLLEELIYVAQETLNELRQRPAPKAQRRGEPILHLLPRDAPSDQIESDAS